MRTITLLFLLAVVLAVPAFAQPKAANDFSLFVAPGYYGHSDALGNSSEIGYGLGYRHSFTDRLALDASVSRFRQTGFVFIPGYQPSLYRYTVHTVPIDVTADYLFTTEGKWKPYAGLGVHAAIIESSPNSDSSRPFSPVVVGGVTFNFARSWGVFVEGRQLLTNDDRAEDPSFRGSFGFRYRF